MKNMKTKITMYEIDLRFIGVIAKPFSQIKNPKTFKNLQYVLKKCIGHKTIKDNDILSSEVFIPRKDGKELRICIYKPKHLSLDKPVTGLLWLHGGGYAMGLPELELRTIKQLIKTSDTVVVSPDYRLSIDAPFPAALEDAYDTLVWMKNHAEELNINRDQLFVGGESAGGGLTCCLSAYARDKGDIAIAFQLPLYPMLDDRMNTQSMLDNNGPIWSQISNETAWKMYLGKEYQSDRVSPYAAPARLESFENLPPTYTFVGAIEPFHDETCSYINHLKKANIPAELDVYSGVFHGFDLMAPHSKAAEKAVSKLNNVYKNAVQTYFKQQKPDQEY